MNCRQVEKRLPDYSAGFMRADLGQRVEAHLARCEDCRERLDEFRRLDQLATADWLTADERVVREIMVRKELAKAWRQWRRRFALETVWQVLVLTPLLVGVVIMVTQPWVRAWLHSLSSWQPNWGLPAQPVPLVALAFVGGLVAWLANWLSEVAT
jgi:predicted anti-sigma-YlaC factor YlaD